MINTKMNCTIWHASKKEESVFKFQPSAMNSCWKDATEKG